MPNLDLFTPVVPDDRVNPCFRNLTASRGYAPAGAMMQQTMDRMGDRDGNFVGSSRRRDSMPAPGSCTYTRRSRPSTLAST